MGIVGERLLEGGEAWLGPHALIGRGRPRACWVQEAVMDGIDVETHARAGGNVHKRLGEGCSSG